uniref:SCP domain-containing protein n=1 Tax=Tetradesmus obliquus TaxID=3088 RepID=A0A383WEJ0_TETOB|eukprot:jgi/Sobl393_1/7064/SZX75680.1
MMSTLPLLVLLLCAAAAAARADEGYDLVSEPLYSEPNNSAAVGISSTVQQTPTPAKFQFIVAEHNKMRAEHGVGPLVWDDTLAQSAATITNQCNFSHDPTLPVGENLAAAIRSSITEEEALERAITSWNGEEAFYDYSKPGFDGATGHFTQQQQQQQQQQQPCVK